MFSTTQQIALCIVPMFTGSLSMIGSCGTLFTIFNQVKKTHTHQSGGDSESRFSSDNRNSHRGSGRHRKVIDHQNNLSPFQRLMIGLSISDFLLGLSCAMSNFAVPTGTVGIWKASGNTQTCVLQGFCTQLGLATVSYSISLAVYFVLSIRTNVRESTTKQIEPFLHAFPIGFAVCTAVSGIFLDSYNPVEWGRTCWVAEYPLGCLDENSPVECVRGKNADNITLLFAALPLVFSYIVIIGCMTYIYLTVRNQMRKIEFRYAYTSSTLNGGDNETNSATVPTEDARNKVLSKQSKERLQKVSLQALLYVSVFFVAHLWTWISFSMEVTYSMQNFILMLLHETFFPLQGFFNFCVFVRPRYKDVRSNHPYVSPLRAIKIVMGLNVEPNITHIRRSNQKSNTSNPDTANQTGFLDAPESNTFSLSHGGDYLTSVTAQLGMILESGNNDNIVCSDEPTNDANSNQMRTTNTC